MTVRIMYRNNWFGGDGWTYYPVTVEISDYCPVCGAVSGKPQRNNYCEDGEWYSVDNWENPCGHIDRYRLVYLEAQRIKKERADAASQNSSFFR